MPQDPIQPAPLPPKLPRPPVPLWMWLLFAGGLVPFAMAAALASGPLGNDSGTVLVFSALGGLIAGLPMVGGLAVAKTFFSGTAARIAGGILFAILIVVGLAAVAFAGCMCVTGGKGLRID